MVFDDILLEDGKIAPFSRSQPNRAAIGRFGNVMLSRDGVQNTNLAWKDTVLVGTGETVDLLVDMTNPGLWMAHCHIAEHIESGMMLNFRVGDRAQASQDAHGAPAHEH